MNTDYYVISYIDDLQQRRPRDIGIVTHHKGNVFFRLMGVDGGTRTVDTSLFAALSERARLNAWVFAEWGNWFFRFSDGEGKDTAAFKLWMTRLQDKGHHISVRNGGAIKLDRNTTIDSRIDTLFAEHVSVPKIRRSKAFTDYINDILTATNLRGRVGFEEKVQIEFLPGQRRASATITLPFVIDCKPRFAFQIVPASNTITTLVNRVSEAVFTLQEAISHGYTTKEYCIVMTCKIKPSCSEIMRPLYELAHVIDVTQPDASDKVMKVINWATTAYYLQETSTPVEIQQLVTLT